MSLKIAFYTVSIIAIISIVLLYIGKSAWQQKTDAIVSSIAAVAVKPPT